MAVLHIPLGQLVICFGKFLDDGPFGRSGRVKADLSAWADQALAEECSLPGHFRDESVLIKEWNGSRWIFGEIGRETTSGSGKKFVGEMVEDDKENLRKSLAYIVAVVV